MIQQFVNPQVYISLQQRLKRVFLFLFFTIFIFSGLNCGSSGSDLFKDILLSLTGDPVTVPASDSSPPVVKIIVPYLGSGGSNVTITNTPKTIKLTQQLINDGFHVIAVTEDLQGAKSINIPIHDVTVVCVSGNVGQNKYYALSGPGSSSSAQIGETATTKIWVDYFVHLAGYTCNPGFNFKSISISFKAEGKNFQNTTVSTAYVTFVYP
ncbi:MAG: hypothetical protein L0Y79_08495 [Chlorobi bacterium]|nr:hypothetical protein [Chlorobiota bacterium]MCI0715444.1 hypothetical protein [Chlorobiota bacterium]